MRKILLNKTLVIRVNTESFIFFLSVESKIVLDLCTNARTEYVTNNNNK